MDTTRSANHSNTIASVGEEVIQVQREAAPGLP